ncbi:uncharacterized protein B0H18DRAFT_1159691 [Fomitopsis serialis]|uniref:uncharacterized protein n=1 Tax=Fomitopsis serialis TaxID=139415 RepID=UPI0020080DB2|nr:uncharacterized protein B0H18DRAFT_1159691 [Neoantrodia serialis]KAH9927741.1 hypothetical protein B0H18DRAFT_1159691 [Neoantrodia serialis]
MSRPFSWLRAPFHFTSAPVTVLAVLIYVVILASVLYTDELTDVPRNTKGLNVDRAYADLHQITVRPHPYLSHANDDVRAYLLSQLELVAAQYDHVHLSDDLTSNASFVSGGILKGQTRTGVYFEGTNILVKIDGTDTPLSDPEGQHDGVLFSAHYDSVSTAPGATDDGMGVVTLVELVRYLAVPEHRPRRTAVFFWNNGEEDGLNGAYTYWKHPWSNLTATFLNLEGAAAGGRPILFRSTSQTVTRAYASKAISHLQADVITGDAFKRGVVRSATDYQIYAAGLKGVRDPMYGLDVAFYKNRAFYHTPRDSIPGMGYGEGKKALWAMLETARGAGLALLNDDDTTDDDGSQGVYFDLFRTKLVLFSTQALFVTNVVFLILGPIVAIVLLAFLVIVPKKSGSGHVAEAPQEIPTNKWTKVKKAGRVVLGWGRFWIALVVGILVHVGLVAGYLNLNPYVVYAHPYVVLVTFLSLSYIAVVGPLQILQSAIPTSPSSQKLVLLLEHYFLTWVLLVVATVQVHKYGVGGVYWITAWNLTAWLAVGTALGEGVVNGWKGGEQGRKAGLDLSIENDYDATDGSGRRFVTGVRYDAPVREDEEHGENGRGDEPEGGEVETDPTEITPLMYQQRESLETGSADPKYGEYGWWILQMVFAVPVVATLLFQLEYLLLQALMNTLVDGSSALNLYGCLSALSLIIFLPIAPFAHRLHHWLTVIVLVVFALTLITSWTMFPFSQERPFKVFFQQQVEIRTSSAATGPVGAASVSSDVLNPDVRVWTVLTGLPGYVDRRLVPELPSSWGKDVQCETDTVLKPGLLSCKWESDLVPSPGGTNTSGDYDQWIDVKTTRLNETNGMVFVKGTNTRGCRLYFDKPITYYKIHDVVDAGAPGTNATGEFLPGYEMPKEGIKDLKLWSREWERGFLVEVGWNADSEDGFMDDTMGGRAACEWAEYASASDGHGQGGLIPALEEVKAFLPLWAQPTKTTDGLVEAWMRFSI